MKKIMYENSDYWLVRGKDISECTEKISEYEKEDLVALIINNRLNDFVSHYSDYEENEQPQDRSVINGKGHGKRIPYIGWFWRSTDFVAGNISIGDCGDFIGVMENNKWGYPERKLTGEEAKKVQDIVWKAKVLSEQGGCVADIEKQTRAKLEELWGLFQTFDLTQPSKPTTQSIKGLEDGGNK